MSGRSPGRPAPTVAALTEAVARRSAGRLDARLDGDGSLVIDGTATLELAGERELAFLANPRYRSVAEQSRAGLLALSPGDAATLFPHGRPRGALLVTRNPYAWFAFAVQELAQLEAPDPGIHPGAQVDASAQVDRLARLEAGVVVGAGSRIAAGAWIGAGTVLGAGVAIGHGTRLAPRVVVYDGCTLGARCLVHSGAVIGADGFGFAPLDGTWVKIPQTGAVRIGDDVEIGANTTIDRGAIDDTVIEDGVKIDNQVQIAHNCRIGAHTAIAGCVGIAGSATIGRHCQLGGAAMIAGHLSLADHVIISGGTLVSRSIREPGFYSGVFPLMTNRDWERNAAVVRHLDDLRGRLRRLEARLRADRVAPSGDSGVA